MRPQFKNINVSNVREVRDRTSAFTFDNAENGSIVFLSDDKRRRAGKLDYAQFVQKVGGAKELVSVSGATGKAKGGILWINPDETSTNRSRIIYAYNSIVYLYDITNDTNYKLRDIGTIDSETISYLSGIQMKSSAYFTIGDSTLSTTLYKYTGTTSGVISAFADYSVTVAGTVKVTDTAHGMQTGNTVTIAGTTSYNATYSSITKIDANNFYVTATWVADDATGTWTGETLTKETITALNAGKYIGQLDSRLMVSGVGSSSDNVQYSFEDTSGSFTNFTASTAIDEGGNLSGSLNKITALHYYKGFGWVFEKDKVTPHKITNYDEYGVGRLKDIPTIVEDGIIDGAGVSSPKAVTNYNDSMYFISEKKGLFEFNTRTGLKELSKPFRPLMKEFDFSNASIAANENNNELIITCATQGGIASDFQLIWSFDSASLSFSSGKFINQVFWDDVNEKMYGLGSTAPQVLEVFTDFYTNEDENVQLQAETRAYDMEDMYKKKSFVSISCNVGAVNSSQSFTVEIFVDDNTFASATFTRSVSDLLSQVATGSTSWGDEAWGGGSAAGQAELSFFTIFWRGFVPRFEKIFVRVTENGPYKSVIHQPVVRYKNTTEKVNSFNSTF